jgi:hypothetical protein
VLTPKNALNEYYNGSYNNDDYDMNAKELYELGCDAYLQQFCEKHGYYYERNCWVAGDIGGIACINDYFVDMATIRVDVDENVEENEFIEWYDYCLQANEYGLTTPNYSSWVKGCPRTSKAKFNEFASLKEELNRLIEEEKKKTVNEC